MRTPLRSTPTPCAILITITCLGVLLGLAAGRAWAEEAKAKTLPEPPVRRPAAAERAKACLECHEEMVDLLVGDKHIADDFHCVTCHGESAAHLAMDIEGTLPDRTWRRWDTEKNAFQWRVKNASLEIAKYCASCHARKPPAGSERKTIDWDEYLETGHGLAVAEGDHDAPACTDCHYAHGAGCEPLTDATVVERCSICHDDRAMMRRAGIDPKVVAEFQAGTHATMKSASAREKATCIRCHPPH